MTPSFIINTVVVMVVAVISWLLKTGYDSWVKKVDGKVDKSCHDECTKAKEKMESLLLAEIRALRGSQEKMSDSFEEKSKIVVEAVTKK